MHMTDTANYTIAVFAGDGIGPEVTNPTIELLNAVSGLTGGFTLTYDHLEAGAEYYVKSGKSIEDGALDRAAAADAILLGAMGLPEVRYEDGTEISPQLDLRETFELYAGERPVMSFRGLPSPLVDERAKDINFVLVRESTEGLFSSRKDSRINGREARDELLITRRISEKLFDHAFQLARRRKAQGFPGRVTCVDKANVLSSFAFFREVFFERAQQFPDIEADCAYVDACGLAMIKSPWDFDVLVTENMFGDILSDVGAALMGGMGLAPSSDIGDEHAVFQPCHGSAPDIIGQGKANPVATFLSAAMMLEWLGERHGNASCTLAANILNDATFGVFENSEVLPWEMGGTSGTEEITRAVLAALEPSQTALAAAR
jgi:3-isopropylmalate dehydrogenase